MVSDPWAVSFDSTVQQTFTVQYNNGNQYDHTSIAAWSSDDASVATVNARAVSGVAACSANLLANDQDVPLYSSGCYTYTIECPLNTGEVVSSPGNVQVPGALTSTSKMNTYVNQVAKFCNGDPLDTNPNNPRWGTQDCITYTLVDTNTPPNAITTGSFTASETFTFKSGTWLDPTPFSNRPLTNGMFIDEQSVFSQTGPIPSNFTEDFLQVITVTNTSTNQTTTVRRNCVAWNGATVTVTDVTSNPDSCT